MSRWTRDEDLLHGARAYAAYKAGGLGKSKGGSTIPPIKRHSHSFPWRGIANVSACVVDAGAAVSVYFLSRDDVL